MMLRKRRVKLMILYLLVVVLEFQKYKKWSKSTLMVKNQIDTSTQMKLLLMVPLFRVLFYVVMILSIKISFYWMLFLLLWVLRLLVVLWPKLYLEIRRFQPKNLKFLLHIKTIKKLLLFKSSKEKDHLQKTIINWVNLTLLVFHQLQEVLHRLKSHSK